MIVDGELQPSTEGTPQGGPLSPLLANILLDDLDKALERRGLPFVRYADDFVIFTKSERAARTRVLIGAALPDRTPSTRRERNEEQGGAVAGTRISRILCSRSLPSDQAD